MKKSFLLAATLSAAFCMQAAAEDGKWTQVTNLPKGLNEPPGASLSILGIEPGANIEEVRAVVAKLLEENVPGPELTQEQINRGSSTTPPMQESEAGVQLTTPGGDVIKLTYAGRIDLNRDLGDKRRVRDELRVDFSAPSSGQQVISAKRRIQYYDEADEPRVTPLIDDMTARFGGPPIIWKANGGGVTEYRWQFDGGKAVKKSDPGQFDCPDYAGDVFDSKAAQALNGSGECDVVLSVDVKSGISDDHASELIFTLSDNERAKADMATDFDYFRNYVKTYQQGAGGAAPAL